MDSKQKYQKWFLAFALSVAMTVAYMPSGLMAYADVGEGQPGEPAVAEFTNKYNLAKSENYTASGSVDLSAAKQLLGGKITADDNFTFELVDEGGKVLQSKSCDNVSDADNSVTDSPITFDTINYTLDDLEFPEDEIEDIIQAELGTLQRMYESAKAEYEAQHAGDDDAKPFMSLDEYSYQSTGMSLSEYTEHLREMAEQTTLKEKTFIYYVHEVKGEDPDVTYDSNRYYYKVHAADNGQGKIETRVTLWEIGEEDIQVEDITFVNSKKTQIKATVKKVWDDDNDKAGKRPGSLTVGLYQTVNESAPAAEPQPVKDANGNAVTVTLTAANNWESTIEDLPKYDADVNEITYSWKESATELPERYTLSGAETEGTVTTLTNRYTPVPPTDCKIQISKVDEDGEEISGAVFEVYKTDVGAAKKLTASDYKWLNSNGSFTIGYDPFTISGLADGTYEIREVKAPSGYKIDSKKPVTFTITGGVLDPAKNKIAANVRYEMTGNDGTYMFTITNNSDKETNGVNTGDTIHLTLYLGILAAAALLLIATVIRRRREEQ